MKNINLMKNKALLFLFAVAFAAAALPMLLPAPAGAQSGNTPVTIINTEGTLGTGGQYAQSTGNFTRVAEGTPTPTPSPTPTSCVPSPGSPGGKIYFGTYMLSNGENGNFSLIVNNGTNAASGIAAPEDFPDNPVIVEQGAATVALQVNTAANTGSGSISFTSGNATVSGNVTILGGITFPATPPVLCSRPNSLDFDGDGKADLGVFRSSNATWYFNRSTAGLGGAAFGAPTDRLAPADYDGDGKADLAVYRSGVWYILQSANNQVRAASFGAAEDLPRPGDFDGDGRADVAVFRPSIGTWFYRQSSNGAARGVQFGQAGDVPMLADFDGDAKTDVAVFRPANGVWYWIRSSDGATRTAAFGQAGDVPLNGDFNGDGRSDLAVYRPADGTWYVARPTGTPAQNFEATRFGTATDAPAPADYDGDGRTDIAVFRDGIWYLINSGNSQLRAARFGQNGDRPIQSANIQ